MNQQHALARAEMLRNRAHALIEHAAGEERESEQVSAAADALEQAVREIEIAIEYRGGEGLIDHPGRQEVRW
ncbi:MAG: hypothetical protein WA813_00445 [Beijerinckiaceae bacterium]